MLRVLCAGRLALHLARLAFERSVLALCWLRSIMR